MVYLLDTHALIWWLEADDKLPESVQSIIDNDIKNTFLSIISPWEIAIKSSIGKLHDVGDFQRLLRRHDFSLLSINLDHIEAVKTLPHHHRDPFDRMLIAQALTENLTLLSNEAIFDAYRVKRVWE